MPRSSNTRAIKKAISLPPDRARCAVNTAGEEGKSLSAVVQDAMRAYGLSLLRGEYGELQRCWSRQATEKGILTEEDLARYLGS